jgi:hypothetical protein
LIYEALKDGPKIQADLMRACGAPAGSMPTIMKHHRFRLRDDQRWELVTNGDDATLPPAPPTG